MPSWCRQVNWGNCGIPWVKWAVLCVKDDWKEQFWGLCYCLSKLRSLLIFKSGMTSHSKIAQFNWECIGRFRQASTIFQKGRSPLEILCARSLTRSKFRTGNPNILGALVKNLVATAAWRPDLHTSCLSLRYILISTFWEWTLRTSSGDKSLQ